MGKLLPGDHVLKGEYKGIVTREYLLGMYEVKLDSGLVVAPGNELKFRHPSKKEN